VTDKRKSKAEDRDAYLLFLIVSLPVTLTTWIVTSTV